jgi:hypothetical protein
MTVGGRAVLLVCSSNFVYARALNKRTFGSNNTGVHGGRKADSQKDESAKHEQAVAFWAKKKFEEWPHFSSRRHLACFFTTSFLCPTAEART